MGVRACVEPMLAALTTKAIAEILLALALVPFLIGYLIRRRRRIPPSWLESRSGRVALSDKGRVRLAKRGYDVAAIEASIAETFETNEQGEIVLTEAGCEVLWRGAGEGRRERRRKPEAEESARET